MYQIEPRMSTCVMAIAQAWLGEIRLFGVDHAVFGGTVPTSVTCPILRPGRGAPLP